MFLICKIQNIFLNKNLFISYQYVEPTKDKVNNGNKCIEYINVEVIYKIKITVSNILKRKYGKMNNSEDN